MRRWAAAMVAAGVLAGYVRVRPWFLQWGLAPGEADAPLPGDDLVRAPDMVTTRGISIDAPPGDVWPWLVQMGQGKGAFYSYDWLENLFGLDLHNATSVVEGWQGLAVGDQLRAAPDSAGPEAGFTVVAIDPGRSLVTVVGDPARVLPQAQAGDVPDGATWAFVLQPLGQHRTRLLVRLCARFDLPAPASWVVQRVLEPVHFVMERKQLLGIRARAGGVLAPQGLPIAPVVSPVSASTG